LHISAIPALSLKSSKQSRAAAYRLIRHAIVDAESVRKLTDLGIDWYIIRSLNRDMKHAAEKEQVIKLIRSMIEIGTIRREANSSSSTTTTFGNSSIVPLSEAVTRAVIAVAEQPDDPFRLICIQTLAEILVVDIDLLARTDGIRFLLHVLSDGPEEIAPILASTFLHVVDSPRTRSYLHIGTDLEMALSAVTDSYGKDSDHAEKMRACTKVILLMLRTWSGEFGPPPLPLETTRN
jgi:large subunit ribosomal protein L17e